MSRPPSPYFPKTSPFFDTPFNKWEPFDCPPRPQWLLDVAHKYDADLDPAGSPFQTGLLLDTTETPGYTLSIAGSHTGKSRALLMETIIMCIGKVPICLAFDKGVDTGIPREVNEWNIKVFGQLPDGSCGTIKGVGKYPVEKLKPVDGSMEVWIGSYKEIKEKMWRKRLEELIPPSFLKDHRGNKGWSDRRQTYSFTTGALIRLITFEQQYTRTEGDFANLIVLDEEPPDRNYFISAIEHCTYLRLCFTPIKGLGWSYYDCYLPAIQNKKSPVKIFNCTQYESPFQDREKVDAKLLTYKNFEIKSRVFGQFSDVSGRPYYSFELTQQFLKAYIPRHTLAKILPMSKPEVARDAINIKMRLEPAESAGDDVWEIYEKVTDHDAYWLSADIGEGNDNPDLAANASAANVRRLPRADEKDPVMVAALRSRMRNVEFAWTCLWAAVYHNCCLIAPETGVSADGAVFITTIKGYPYIYRHASTNDKTHMLQEKFGFDSKNASRKYAFDLVGSWIYSHMDRSQIYHYQLLKEINECIEGQGGRPDHPERGSTDCLVAFGISEYVYDLARSQIKNNRVNVEEVDDTRGILFPNIFGMNRKVRETRPVIGSRRGMDQRFGKMTGAGVSK